MIQVSEDALWTMIGKQHFELEFLRSQTDEQARVIAEQAKRITDLEEAVKAINEARKIEAEARVPLKKQRAKA